MRCDAVCVHWRHKLEDLILNRTAVLFKLVRVIALHHKQVLRLTYSPYNVAVEKGSLFSYIYFDALFLLRLVSYQAAVLYTF